MNKGRIFGYKVEMLKVRSRHTLRLDAKQDDPLLLSGLELDSSDWIEIGEFLPEPLFKGKQPNYLPDNIEFNSDEMALVLNTLSIRPYSINYGDCRAISSEEFENLNEERKLKKGDLILTMDGGTSIGKAAILDNEGNYTLDSHLSVLRPKAMTPLLLMYLLNSPIGQQQFKLAESGSSGQTSVNEDDVRRFRFPIKDVSSLETKVIDLHKRAREIEDEISQLQSERFSLSSGLLEP